MIEVIAALTNTLGVMWQGGGQDHVAHMRELHEKVIPRAPVDAAGGGWLSRPSLGAARSL
jgi:hypothetical protein